MRAEPEKLGPLTLSTQVEHWSLVSPFRITGRIWEVIDVLRVTVGAYGAAGLGEATGVYYRNETPWLMSQQIERVRSAIERGINRDALQCLLPSGGARSALDNALWDLEAKVTGRSVWQIAGLSKPRALLTTFTCGADTPRQMAAAARSYRGARAIKLKLTGETVDADRVRAVRESLPDIWLSVDANQGFTQRSLESLMPTLSEARVQLIEQPFTIGQEALLEGFHSPIPIAADESVQCLADVPGLVGRFSVMNIKLDKCGGLTEGLAMARRAQELGLECMVGNMMGTSLAMAPAYLVGQLCKVVDLDGPVFLKTDRPVAVQYTDGMITCPEALWG